MQNSERLQELYNASLNSNGAANEQYSKTLESLETKLTRLKNAWDEFTTGLLNNDVIKFGVDLLNNILTALNNITNTGNDIVDTVAKITLLIAALRTAKAAMDALADSTRAYKTAMAGGEDKDGNIIDPKDAKTAGAMASKVFGESFKKNLLGKIGTFFTSGKSIGEAIAGGIKDGFGRSSIGFIVVIILTVVAIIAKVIYETTSLTKKLEDAENAAKEAESAFNKLNEGLTELKDNLSDVADQTSALEDLTRGTDEWREAQEKLNESVDELVEKYPELVSFVEMDKYGTKSIDMESDAVQNVIQNYENRTAQAKAASLGAANYVSELKVQKAEREWDDETKKVQQQKIKNNQKSLAKNALSLVDETNYSEKSYDQMATMASEHLAETMTEAAEKTYESGTYNQRVEDREAMAKAIYGSDATVGGFGNNTITYYDEEGKKQTVKLRKEEWASQVAAYKATNNMTEALEKVPDTINKMTSELSKSSSKASKALSNIFEKGTDVGKLSANDYNELKDVNVEDLIPSDASDELKDSITETFNEIFENLKLAAEQVQERSEKYGLDENALNNVETETANAWLDKLENLGRMGGNRIEMVQKAMDEITKGMTDEIKSDFLGAVSSSDWTKQGLSSLGESLEALEVSVPTAALNKFKSALLEATGAVNSFGKLTEEQQITLAKNLNRKSIIESNGVLSAEEYQTLIAADESLKDSFIKNLDGEYVYTEKIDTLIDVVEEINGKIGTKTNSNNAKTYDAIIAAQQKLSGEWKSEQGKVYNSWQDVTHREGLVDIAKDVQEILKEFFKTDEDVPNFLTEVGYKTTTDFNDATYWDKDKIVEFLNAIQGSSTTGALEEYINEEIIKGQGQKATENVTRFYSADGGISPKYDELGDRQKAIVEAQRQILVAKATSAGITQEEIKAYETLVDKYEDGKDVYRQMLGAQIQLANKINYDEMREGLQGLISDMADFVEEYDKIVDGDKEGKRNVIDSLAQNLGINLSNKSEKQLDELTEIIMGTATGNEGSYYQLVMEIAKSVERDAFGDIKSIEEMIDIINKDGISAHQELINKLTDNSLGVISQTSSGGKIYQQFELVSEAILKSSIELAGAAEKLWESPYTWLDNYNERLNSLLRTYDKLERKYDKLASKTDSTPQDLINTTRQELSSLSERAQTYKYGAANAQNEIKNLINSNAEFAKYIAYDASRNEVLVDWENVKKTDWWEETGQDFEEMVSEVKENRDAYNDAVDGLEDIEDTIEEIKNRGRDEYSDLLDAVKEGWVNEQQEQIDKLQEINDTIEESQNKLLSSMREQIEEERRARENQKTEASIEDKRLKLAYLQRDTSGANAVEIAALQKEIGEDEEAYTDSLIDQRFDEIEKANEEAAQQRQTQIDIQQKQLDAFVDSGQVWNHIKDIVDKDLQDYNNGDTTWQQTQSNFYSMWSKENKDNPIQASLKEDENLKAAKLAAEYVSKQEGDSQLAKDIGSVTTAVTKYQEDVQKLATSVGNHEITLSFDGDILGTKLTELIKATVKPESLKTEDEVVTEPEGGSNVETPAISSNFSGKYSQLKNFIKGQNLFSGGLSIKGNGELANGGNSEGNDNKTLITDETVVTPYQGLVHDTNLALDKISFYDDSEGSNINSAQLVDKTKSANFDKNVVSRNTGNNIVGNNLSVFTVAQRQGVIKQIKDDRTLARLKTISFPTSGDIYEMIDNENKRYGLAVNFDGVWYKLNTELFREKASKSKKTYFDNLSGLKEYNYSLWTYKSGGLADFTGPAWLDGTKSSPELVLNAQDTQNFIALKDILASILSNNTSTDTKKSSGGDNYYDINIEVDEVASDYDVDQIADRIKEIIYEDATYRNVSIINSVK